MNLYLIENDASIPAILSRDDYRAVEDVVVCFNYLPYLRLTEGPAAHCALLIEELFTPADYRDLHSAVDRFAGAWYRADQRDVTLHDGSSFGEITEIMLSKDFILNVLVKYGEAVRLAAARFPGVKTIRHDFSNDSNSFQFYVDDRGRFFNKQRLVETVGEQLGVPVLYLECSRLIPSRWKSSTARFFDPATLGPMHQLKQAIKAWGGALLNGLAGLRHRTQEDTVYFFSYFNIRSLLHLAGPHVLIPTPSGKQVTQGVRYLDFMRVEAALGPDDRKYLEQLGKFSDSFAESLRGKLTFRGIDYSEIFMPPLAELCRVRIPELLLYHRRVESAIRRHSIRRMVTIDILSEIGKTRLAVSRKCGVQSVFIDHGIMGHDIAQQSSSGANPDLIIKPDSFDPGRDRYPYNITARALTLGNPCTDPYPSINRKRVSRVERVLLTTFSSNFYARLDTVALQEKYFKELFAAIPALHAMGLEIHYRPHHENPDYHRYLFDFFRVDPGMVRISKWSTPFSRLIYDMDLYVGHASTTFYEALAAGVPAVFLDPGHIPEAYFPPFNGKSGDEVLRVETAAELTSIAQRNRRDATELARFMENFHTRHARRYLFDLDGKAADRIARFAFMH